MACVLMPHPAWWRCEILLGYETGLRRDDAHRVMKADIMHDGTITVRQHKTRQIHTAQVRPETAAELLALPEDPPLTLPHSLRIFYRDFARLRTLAGVDGGAHQQLRRTGATLLAVETESIDAAREWLGQRSFQQIRHYIDRRIYHPRGHLPPRIAG
jgi:integrase